MANLNDLVDQISKLSVLEVSELVKLLEDKFGVTAAAPAVAVAAAPAQGDGEAKEEKTSFDVILVEAGAKKIDVIKEVRALTSLGLKEAKELVEAGNKAVKEGVSKAEAEEAKTKLTAAGATVNIA